MLLYYFFAGKLKKKLVKMYKCMITTQSRLIVSLNFVLIFFEV